MLRRHVRADAEHKRLSKAPLGLATTSYEQGDLIFQAALPVDGRRASTIAQIEALGWRLDHVGYAFVPDGSTSVSIDR